MIRVLIIIFSMAAANAAIAIAPVPSPNCRYELTRIRNMVQGDVPSAAGLWNTSFGTSLSDSQFKNAHFSGDNPPTRMVVESDYSGTLELVGLLYFFESLTGDINSPIFLLDSNQDERGMAHLLIEKLEEKRQLMDAMGITIFVPERLVHSLGILQEFGFMAETPIHKNYYGPNHDAFKLVWVENQFSKFKK